MILSKFKNIEAVVLDVDGVLTDGSVLVNEEGEQLRTFHVRDGYAIQLAVKSGLQVWAITGGYSAGVEKRLLGLGLTEVFIGVQDKKACLLKLVQQSGIDIDHIMYVGDDMPDLPCMELVGVPVCPGDAVEEIKQISKYISPKNGGQGVARDVLEKVLKLKGDWVNDLVV